MLVKVINKEIRTRCMRQELHEVLHDISFEALFVPVVEVFRCRSVSCCARIKHFNEV